MGKNIKDLVEKGKKTRFTSTNQPKNKGNKPKLYTTAKGVYNVSYDEFKEVAKYLMQCTKKELEEITKADDTPMWIVNICRAMYADTGKGDIRTLSQLLEHIFGKPTQTVNLQAEVKGQEMSREDILKELKRLRESREE